MGQIPTDEQLQRAGLTRSDYDQRNALWHKMLAQIEPDERARIQAEPTGAEALGVMMLVELALSPPPNTKIDFESLPY